MEVMMCVWERGGGDGTVHGLLSEGAWGSQYGLTISAIQSAGKREKDQTFLHQALWLAQKSLRQDHAGHSDVSLSVSANEPSKYQV